MKFIVAPRTQKGQQFRIQQERRGPFPPVIDVPVLRVRKPRVRQKLFDSDSHPGPAVLSGRRVERMRAVRQRQAGQEQQEETMPGPDSGHRLRQSQQWPLLLVGLFVGVEPASHHQPLRFVAQDRADHVRHHVPGREQQAFRRLLLALERSFQRPVRQRGRHPQQAPQPFVDQFAHQLPQLCVPRVDGSP